MPVTRHAVHQPWVRVPSVFSPASVAGLKGWFDSSNLASITASGGAVSQLNDLSGNGNHMSQGTGSAQPTTGTRTVNGLNALDFDGVDDTLNNAATRTWLPTGSVLAVFDADTIPPNGFVIWAGSNSGFGNEPELATYWNGTGWYDGQTVLGTWDTNLHVLGIQFNGAAGQIRLDGTSLGTVTSVDLSTFALSVAGWIGSLRNSNLHDGLFSELLRYEPAVSLGDFALLEAWLKAKWGTP